MTLERKPCNPDPLLTEGEVITEDRPLLRRTHARYSANGAQYVLCGLFIVKINAEHVNSLKVVLKPAVNLYDPFKH